MTCRLDKRCGQLSAFLHTRPFGGDLASGIPADGDLWRDELRGRGVVLYGADNGHEFPDIVPNEPIHVVPAMAVLSFVPKLFARLLRMGGENRRQADLVDIQSEGVVVLQRGRVEASWRHQRQAVAIYLVVTEGMLELDVNDAPAEPYQVIVGGRQAIGRRLLRLYAWRRHQN